MREIKFRAWDKANEAMSRPFEIWEAKDMVMGVYMTHTIRDPNDFLPIVMQYTGLHDKNGKEIYEGDVARWGEDGRIASIEWDGQLGAFTTDGDCIGALIRSNPNKLEVIGNIYSNPELLQ